MNAQLKNNLSIALLYGLSFFLLWFRRKYAIAQLIKQSANSNFDVLIGKSLVYFVSIALFLVALISSIRCLSPKFNMEINKLLSSQQGDNLTSVSIFGLGFIMLWFRRKYLIEQLTRNINSRFSVFMATSGMYIIMFGMFFVALISLFRCLFANS